MNNQKQILLIVLLPIVYCMPTTTYKLDTTLRWSYHERSAAESHAHIYSRDAQHAHSIRDKQPKWSCIKWEPATAIIRLLWINAKWMKCYVEIALPWQMYNIYLWCVLFFSLRLTPLMLHCWNIIRQSESSQRVLRRARFLQASNFVSNMLLKRKHTIALAEYVSDTVFVTCDVTFVPSFLPYPLLSHSVLLKWYRSRSRETRQTHTSEPAGDKVQLLSRHCDVWDEFTHWWWLDLKRLASDKLWLELPCRSIRRWGHRTTGRRCQKSKKRRAAVAEESWSHADGKNA